MPWFSILSWRWECDPHLQPTGNCTCHVIKQNESEAGLELDRGNQGHCMPLSGFVLDALRPLPTLRALFTTSWPWCLLVTLPSGLIVPPPKKILIRSLVWSRKKSLVLFLFCCFCCLFLFCFLYVLFLFTFFSFSIRGLFSSFNMVKTHGDWLVQEIQAVDSFVKQ